MMTFTSPVCLSNTTSTATEANSLLRRAEIVDGSIIMLVAVRAKITEDKRTYRYPCTKRNG